MRGGLPAARVVEDEVAHATLGFRLRMPQPGADEALARLQVHVGPALGVGAGLHQRQIKWAEGVADGLEAVEVAGVSAEEHAQVRILDDP
ncbi:hypothetical protein G6F63_015634 [Rhizopus arrhizus]|nr:hypothetical protein G6F63_015634 [Rhizopus arrhizus]